ncbi:MAG: hypothetical protein ACRC2R_01240 [Xenococcaceae cyanobacterium]
MNLNKLEILSPNTPYTAKAVRQEAGLTNYQIKQAIITGELIRANGDYYLAGSTNLPTENETVIYRRATIMIGDREIDVLREASKKVYFMNQTMATKAIGKQSVSILDFLSGKSPEALSVKGFSILEKVKIEGYNKTVSIVPLAVVEAYWTYWTRQGSVIASELTRPLTTSRLHEKAALAFGESLSESAKKEVEKDIQARARQASRDAHRALHGRMGYLVTGFQGAALWNRVLESVCGVNAARSKAELGLKNWDNAKNHLHHTVLSEITRIYYKIDNLIDRGVAYAAAVNAGLKDVKYFGLVLLDGSTFEPSYKQLDLF